MDVAEINTEIKSIGLDYPHVVVCDSLDNMTKQHDAGLSNFPLTDVKRTLDGREGYLKEPDDPETKDDTGISRGMRYLPRGNKPGNFNRKRSELRELNPKRK